MAEIDTTKSSGNVFVDLGFESGEAAVMLARVEVAIHIAERLKNKAWTQEEAALQLSITQAQFSQLRKGKPEKLSLDTLWMIAIRSGLDLQLKLTERQGEFNGNREAI
ncbi:helix-turn-helix domain-containing protein [Herbaspirillum robiniae]|uniref:helix-turn-helix domain-containing protein n=1 Tax=Herbaspirillum robiniae TaxID=2014887 RepID=UPI003D78A92A